MNAETHLQPVQGKAVWGARVRLAAVVVCATAAMSCGQVVRTGQGSSYLVLTTLQSAAGSSVVQSDVRKVDVVTGASSVVNDPATALFQVAMKDTLISPSQVNDITITQYHVKYTRTDGRNTQGVDVPYEFDGAVTVTISGTGSVSFTLVRNQAKLEAPLAALAQSNIPVTTIATVTFFGHDQTGREASVSGSIEVTFANFPD